MQQKFDIGEDVLIALRRVIRAIDQHSRKLAQTHGLTGPQAILLNELFRNGARTGSELAHRLSLSHATITDIVKRLESRALLERMQDPDDGRRQLLKITRAGQKLVQDSVPLLQEHFLQRLSELDAWEQSQLLSSLQRIASMMDAEDLEAAPLLTSGAATASAEAVTEVTASTDSSIAQLDEMK